MSSLDSNTVAAHRQLRDSGAVSFFGESGMKVMFVGNSITRHGVNPGIGWNNDWGMAASALEKDYVHILADRLSAIRQAEFCVCQNSEWELNYKRGESKLPLYRAAQDFGADIIICRFIENVPTAGFEPEVFMREYRRLLAYLGGEKADFVLTTGFWHHPGDAQIEKLAAEDGYPLVRLGDLGDDDGMKAIGRFAHSGVASHPGDDGMAAIAERIFAAVRDMI